MPGSASAGIGCSRVIPLPSRRFPGDQASLPAQRPDEGAVGALGQAISNRLFTAGLDLSSVLMLVHDEPTLMRLQHAVDELDEALRDLRRLMLMMPEQA